MTPFQWNHRRLFIIFHCVGLLSIPSTCSQKVIVTAENPLLTEAMFDIHGVETINGLSEGKVTTYSGTTFHSSGLESAIPGNGTAVETTSGFQPPQRELSPSAPARIRSTPQQLRTVLHKTPELSIAEEKELQDLLARLPKRRSVLRFLEKLRYIQLEKTFEALTKQLQSNLGFIGANLVLRMFSHKDENKLDDGENTKYRMEMAVGRHKLATLFRLLKGKDKSLLLQILVKERLSGLSRPQYEKLIDLTAQISDAPTLVAALRGALDASTTPLQTELGCAKTLQLLDLLLLPTGTANHPVVDAVEASKLFVLIEFVEEKRGKVSILRVKLVVKERLSGLNKTQREKLKREITSIADVPAFVASLYRLFASPTTLQTKLGGTEALRMLELLLLPTGTANYTDISAVEASKLFLLIEFVDEKRDQIVTLLNEGKLNL